MDGRKIAFWSSPKGFFTLGAFMAAGGLAHAFLFNHVILGWAGVAVGLLCIGKAILLKRKGENADRT